MERGNSKKRKAFGASQIHRVGRLLDMARDVTGDFYALGQDEARGFPYEVCTLNSLEDREIHSEGVLADITRYEYKDSRFGRKRDYYRVALQDHNILGSIKRDTNKVKFSPLMLYVLTHELVHIIRFVKYFVPFHKEEHSRWKEERIVHAITQRLLSRLPLPGMDEILHCFASLGIDGEKNFKIDNLG